MWFSETEGFVWLEWLQEQRGAWHISGSAAVRRRTEAIKLPSVTQATEWTFEF